MHGQAVLGESVLKNADAIEAERPAGSIEELVVAHSQMVFRIAYSILRNHHDAEDACQECFVRAWKYRNKFHKVRKPKTWLARVAWTTALDRRKSRAAVADVAVSLDDSPGLQLLDDSCGPEDLVAAEQRRKVLELLVAGLPDELRWPLELSTVQELDSTEIAEIMGIPEGSVRTRLMRARNLLKEKLQVLLQGRRNG